MRKHQARLGVARDAGVPRWREVLNAPRIVR